jgi:hypothetical protein
MSMKRPSGLTIRAIAVLSFVALTVCSYAVDITEPIRLPKGDLLKESSSVRTQTTYRCGKLDATFTIDVRNGKLVLFEASVNGKKLPADEVKSAKEEMLLNGAFDHVAFFCNEGAYSFSFVRWVPNTPEPYMHSISGLL